VPEVGSLPPTPDSGPKPGLQGILAPHPCLLWWFH